MSEQAEVRDLSQSCPGPGHHTALHQAAMVGNSDAMAGLIQGGCAVDLQDREGNTALHEVSWHGFSPCVKLLVKAGADVHIRNKAGNTALHLACQNAHAPTARLLLLGGSTPQTKNNMGDTCLHVAARYNHLNLVKILLSSLCPVTEGNQVGDTALHVAAALNHKGTVQLLLDTGADGTVRNNTGKTALDKARDNNHREVALLLARAPQVHRFMRGRTVRRRRGRLRAERRGQSAATGGTQPNKDSSSMVEESPSSDPMESRTPADMLDPGYQKTAVINRSSYSLHRRRRVKTQAFTEDCLRKRKRDIHARRDELCDGEYCSSQNGKTYQLYTLYRDKKGNIKQAPANGCYCTPVLKKLEGQLKVTQEEMRVHILNIQEQVNDRLVKMDRRSRHQIKVLDLLNQERASAERKDMIYMMEQRVARGREDTLMTQALVSHELKRWCMSQLKEMDVHIPVKSQYYKLLPSPSVERSVADTELESLPLLSVASGDSSNSLATYVNILPTRSAHGAGGPETEQPGGRKYFEMKMDRSPDDYENIALVPLPAEKPSSLLRGSADPLRRHPALQYGPAAAVVPLGRGGLSSSSSQSSICDQGLGRIRRQERCNYRQPRSERELMRAHRHAGIPTDGARTLEFLADRPTEPTFSQERNNLHAKEVTQHFFETVSTQLERWYERKVAEVKQQTAARAQQDSEELLERINVLEEELQRLRTNETAES